MDEPPGRSPAASGDNICLSGKDMVDRELAAAWHDLTADPYAVLTAAGALHGLS
jgi:hypothetical protein